MYIRPGLPPVDVIRVPPRVRPRPCKVRLYIQTTYIIQSHDAIYNKRNQVSLLLAEDGGGIAPGLQRVLKGAARTAGDRKRGRDGTLYSTHRPSSYYTHHLRAIAAGAALGSARHGNTQIVSKKQRALESRGPPLQSAIRSRRANSLRRLRAAM